MGIKRVLEKQEKKKRKKKGLSEEGGESAEIEESAGA